MKTTVLYQVITKKKEKEKNSKKIKEKWVQKSTTGIFIFFFFLHISGVGEGATGPKGVGTERCLKKA